MSRTSRISRAWWFSLVLLALAWVSIELWTRPHEDSADELVRSSGSSKMPAEIEGTDESGALLPVSSETRSRESGETHRGSLDLPPTAREVLESYWGPLSPEDEAKLLAEGIDLNSRRVIPPWSEVEGALRSQVVEQSLPSLDDSVRARVDWDGVVTQEALSKRFTITNPDRALTVGELREVEVIAQRHNPKLQEMAEQWAAGIRSAVSAKWGASGFEKSPLTTCLVPRDARRAFFAAASAQDQWAVKLRLYADEFPELVQLDSMISETRMARDREIQRRLEQR